MKLIDEAKREREASGATVRRRKRDYRWEGSLLGMERSGGEAVQEDIGDEKTRKEERG